MTEDTISIFPVLMLALLYERKLYPWAFPLLGECTALLCWLFFLQIYWIKNQDVSRFLLMDGRLVRERKVLDLSVVNGSMEAVCDACKKFSEFCEEKGMSMKQTMKISLSMDEHDANIDLGGKDAFWII